MSGVKSRRRRDGMTFNLPAAFTDAILAASLPARDALKTRITLKFNDFQEWISGMNNARRNISHLFGSPLNVRPH